MPDSRRLVCLASPCPATLKAAPRMSLEPPLEGVKRAMIILDSDLTGEQILTSPVHEEEKPSVMTTIFVILAVFFTGFAAGVAAGTVMVMRWIA